MHCTQTDIFQGEDWRCTELKLYEVQVMFPQPVTVSGETTLSCVPVFDWPANTRMNNAEELKATNRASQAFVSPQNGHSPITLLL